MNLEVRQAADGTWHWRRRVNGRITAHGADYNSKAGAVRGLLDDMVSAGQYMLGLDHLGITDEDETRLRKLLRKHVQVVP